MLSKIFLALFLLAAITANASPTNPYCTDFSGSYHGVIDGKPVNLQITQTACELIQSPGRLSLIAPKVQTIFLTDVPAVLDGQVISGRMVNSWLQIQVMNISNGSLASTTVETWQKVNSDRLDISVKRYNSAGIQLDYEDDYSLTRDN